MSLLRATHPDGIAFAPGEDPPLSADALAPLVGVSFDLPCEDPWVRGEGTSGHAYLDAARAAWEEYPDWMDFLDLDSPASDVKRASRDVYLHWWKPWFDRSERVLDVGCGIGRFVHPLLDRGATVWGVDPDLESLRRCAWRAPGRPGRLDLHWSSARRLPDVADLDAIIACEVLCYVPEPEPILADLARRLRPGGALLLAWEARWGWAVAPDASPALPEHLLGATDTIDLPGDRWLRTVDGDALRSLVEGAGLRVERLVPTHYVADGPLERSAPEGLFLEGLLDLEARLREHPVWAPLNRIWTAVAIRD